MSDCYEKRHVKSTRKDHVCEYCGETIPAGSPALYEHGILDNESIITDDFPEWVRLENIPHPTLTCEIECPSCGKVRVMRDDWEHDSWVFCPKCGVSLERSE